jgi:uncharacterized membrane protein (DUF2068 family)
VSWWTDLKAELGRETQPVNTVVRLIILERGIRGGILLVLSLALLTDSQQILGIVRQWAAALDVEAAPELTRRQGFLRQILFNVLSWVGALGGRTVVMIAIGLMAFSLLELTEAVGLARRRRWAEYLTVIAGCLGIPFEIFEVVRRQTVLRLSFLVINVAIVLYLAWAKHLFGLRGGRRTETLSA